MELFKEFANETSRGDFLMHSKVDSLYESLWEEEEFININNEAEKRFAKIRAEIDQLEKEGKL